MKMINIHLFMYIMWVITELNITNKRIKREQALTVYWIPVMRAEAVNG